MGVVAGDIELVRFVGKEQAYMQHGHNKSSPYLDTPLCQSVFRRLRFHIRLQNSSNWCNLPPAFFLLSFFLHASPDPFIEKVLCLCLCVMTAFKVLLNLKDNPVKELLFIP